MSKIDNLPGSVFGLLTVLERLPGHNGSPSIFFQCQCACGNLKRINGYSLLYGATTSCGCKQAAALAASRHKHGHSVGGVRSRTHAAWHGMLQRCNNPNTPGFDNYGGRGIVVCDEWHHFEKFLSDMGEAPEGCTLDRVDNHGNYCKDNCRWADRLVQSRNRRNVPVIEIDGISATAPEWEQHYGLRPRTVSRRIRAGWDPVTACTTPITPGQKVYPAGKRRSCAS